MEKWLNHSYKVENATKGNDGINKLKEEILKNGVFKTKGEYETRIKEYTDRAVNK
jgi:hypothetical protein